MIWELEGVQSQQLALVLLSAEVIRCVQRVLAPCKQHVQHDTSGKDIDTWRVLAFLNQLWTHEYECANLIIVVLLLMLSTQSKVSDLNRAQVRRVLYEYVVRLEVSVHNLVIV